MSNLSEKKIKSLLPHLKGWKYDGQKIYREVNFKAFSDVINVVERIAEIAEAKNHHPDLDIRYTMLRISLVTHDSNGVTENDMAMAKIINDNILKK